MQDRMSFGGTNEQKGKMDRKKPKTGKNRGRLDKKKRIILIASAGVLVIAAALAVIFLTGGDTEDVIDFTVVPDGVTVNGVDISGMTKEQAISAMEKIEDELLSGYECTLEYDGETYTYTAEDFGLSSDYEDILAQAVTGGDTDASEPVGLELTVSLVADEAAIRSALTSIEQSLAQAPTDATMEFMSRGYTEDGTAYDPDPTELADAHAGHDDLERPELVRIAAEDTPNRLRYLYWEEDKYIDAKPADADIARFLYTEGKPGIAVDTDTLVNAIMAQVKSGDDEPITVPVKEDEPDVTVADLKEKTQLISSWTSSYADHDGKARNWNVSRMSSFVDGVIIDPSEEWSINKEAGPRNSKTAKEFGWKKAAGLYQGGTTQQYGGGVCQLGSTTYNAALRADLTIVEFSHHSDPSGYIPKGLDATLDYTSENATGKDLVLGNDGEAPIYLVSYVDPEKMTVTVEVYGQLPYSEEYKQQVIYDYTSDNKGTRYGSGRVNTIEATQTPDDKKLSPENPTIVFSKPRAGYKVEVFKRVYALDGRELENTLLRTSVYQPIDGYTYVYPESLMPTPTIPATATPETSTPAPATSTPAPATSTPAPATSTPVPATSTPAPATSTPATSTPAPATSTP